MKHRGILLSVLFAVGFAVAVSADVFTWKAGADGGWDRPESYENNVANAKPKEGDTVQIPDNVTVVARDGDMALVSSLKTVKTLGSNAKVVFDVTGDHDIECAICGTDEGRSMNGNGIIEKNGAGTVWLKNSSHLYCYYVNIVVNDGILRLQPTTHSNRNQTYRSLTVNSPGVLYTTVNTESPVKTVHFRSTLYGDGMVTNPSAGNVIFYPMGKDPAKIPDFSGQFGGRIQIAGTDGFTYQDFTGTGSRNSESVNVNINLSLGISELGGIGNGQTHYGSTGCGKIVFDGSGTLRYLGDGQIAFTEMQAGDNMQFAHIDAGAVGGLRLCGTLDFDNAAKPLKRLLLTGDNATDCTIEGKMSNCDSGAVYLTKRGSGTWGLLSETAFCDGIIAVESGKLKFSSIRSKGEQCSLGAATVLRSEHAGALQDAEPLPYAYLLGAADTAGTMEYVGGNEAVSDDRAFAVKGAGRIVSTGGTLVLCGGAGSVVSGLNTLHLGGSATRCIMNNVTNGVGVIKVVKEGSGDWSLGGNLGFTGGIDVKEGVLVLGNGYDPGNYTRYRLTLRAKNQGGSGNSFFNLGRVALFNAAGEVQNACLTYNSAANTNESERAMIEPRQLAFVTPKGDLKPENFYNYREYLDSNAQTEYLYIDKPMLNITNLFAAFHADPLAYAQVRHKGREGTSYWPDLGSEKYWPTIEFRMPAGADPVVSYDIGTRFASAAKNDATKTTAKKNWMDAIGSWTLYGSVDGNVWTELSSVTSNDLRGVETTDCSWLSDGTSYATADGWTAHTSGWKIPSRPEGSEVPVYSQFADGMGCVSVSPGAVLRTNRQYEIGELKLGPENGTIDGFSFAEGGTLVVPDAGDSDKVRLSVNFLNATGLENLKAWKVDCGGRRRKVFKVDGSGIVIAKVGFAIIAR